MDPQTPQVEVSAQRHYPLPPILDTGPWYKTRRFRIFIVTLCLSLLISYAYVFSRSAIYQSYATLLTVANTAVDQSSSEADIQHVAIQKQILLGPELLAKTAALLRDRNDFDHTPGVADIRQMLQVHPVDATNLVKMQAEGENPELLPVLINTWIDVYLQARAEQIALSTNSTTDALQQQLEQLSEEIKLKRDELDLFRQQNDISSSARIENEALAHLKGLTDSLNLANDEEIKAKNNLDSIKKAISRGQAVVPQEDTRTLSQLEYRAQLLREDLKEMNQRFTPEYMALKPQLKVMPEKLAELEAKITKMRSEGQTVVLADAEQKYVAAKQATQDIRRQLNAHKRQASAFTTSFTEHEALQKDLENLEQLYRQSQDRLVKLNATQTEKYLQVSIVERAFQPGDPVRPDYLRDALIASIGALLLSLLSVWVIDYLLRPEDKDPALNLSSIRVYNQEANSAALAAQSTPEQLSQQSAYALQNIPARELSERELDLLYQSANKQTKQLIALLLHGLTLEEINKLHPDAVDLQSDSLRIQGKSTRTLPCNNILQTLFSDNNYALLDIEKQPLPPEELSALLVCALIDSGLPAPEEIDADTIRRSYILYLVKQGIKLSELELVLGPLPATELSSYSAYSPAGQGKSFKDINLVHPLLKNSDLNNT